MKTILLFSTFFLSAVASAATPDVRCWERSDSDQYDVVTIEDGVAYLWDDESDNLPTRIPVEMTRIDDEGDYYFQFKAEGFSLRVEDETSGQNNYSDGRLRASHYADGELTNMRCELYH